MSRDLTDLLDETLDRYEQSVNDLKKLNNKFKKICFWYSEEVYRFIGEFRKDNLDPKQLEALNILKSVIDNCIDDNYKERLTKLYITKDFYKNINDTSLQKEVENVEKAFLQDIDGNITDLDEYV